ncbi:DUF421 domain-containing protein [Rossellomorea vietnamensis]|nr:DUF421 domain-containing protein [Rossellomorea vietnamensis]
MATMENMGKISVIPKSYARPVQPSDLNLFPEKHRDGSCAS